MERIRWAPAAAPGWRGPGPALSKRELAVVGLALLLPVPLVALSGLSIPLPGAVERGIASLVPGVAATGVPASIRVGPVRQATPGRSTPVRSTGATPAGAGRPIVARAPESGSAPGAGPSRARGPSRPAGTPGRAGAAGPDRAGSSAPRGERVAATVRPPTGGESEPPPTASDPGVGASAGLSVGPGGTAASLEVTYPGVVQATAGASVSTGLDGSGHPPAVEATVGGGVAGSSGVSGSVEAGVPSGSPSGAAEDVVGVGITGVP